MIILYFFKYIPQYSTSLMILLIAHIVLGAMILVQMDDILKVLKDEMRHMWDRRAQETAFWDLIQRSVRVFVHLYFDPDRLN